MTQMLPPVPSNGAACTFSLSQQGSSHQEQQMARSASTQKVSEPRLIKDLLYLGQLVME